MGTVQFDVENYKGPLTYYVNSTSQASTEKKYPDPLIFDLNEDGRFDSLDVVQYSPSLKRAVSSVSEGASQENPVTTNAREVLKHYTSEASDKSEETPGHQVEVAA